MRLLVTVALMSAGIATSGAATPTASILNTATAIPAVTTDRVTAHIWLAKDKDDGKDGKKAKKAKAKSEKKADKAKSKARKAADKSRKKAKKEVEKTAKKAGKKAEKAVEKSLKDNGKRASNGKVKVRGADWDQRAERILGVAAPANRDMLTLLGVAALALAGPQLVVADTPVEELITYRNCPPGLAKKTPACVPPGLAKKGVTQEQWLSHDEAYYDALWLEQREVYLNDDSNPIDDVTPAENLLLQSAQIASLFGLSPAPDGQHYALIDGMPVLLDEKDYSGLLLINDLAKVTDLAGGVDVAPTAALTQDELQRLYRLPVPEVDTNYAVLNGQVIQLSDSQYETLQLIRIARAVL